MTTATDVNQPSLETAPPAAAGCRFPSSCWSSREASR